MITMKTGLRIAAFLSVVIALIVVLASSAKSAPQSSTSAPAQDQPRRYIFGVTKWDIKGYPGDFDPSTRQGLPPADFIIPAGASVNVYGVSPYMYAWVVYGPTYNPLFEGWVSAMALEVSTLVRPNAQDLNSVDLTDYGFERMSHHVDNRVFRPEQSLRLEAPNFEARIFGSLEVTLLSPGPEQDYLLTGTHIIITGLSSDRRFVTIKYFLDGLVTYGVAESAHMQVWVSGKWVSVEEWANSGPDIPRFVPDR